MVSEEINVGCHHCGPETSLQDAFVVREVGAKECQECLASCSNRRMAMLSRRQRGCSGSWGERSPCHPGSFHVDAGRCFGHPGSYRNTWLSRKLALKDMVIRIVDASGQHGCLQYLSEASMADQARQCQRVVCSSTQGILEGSRFMKNLVLDSSVQEERA